MRKQNSNVSAALCGLFVASAVVAGVMAPFPAAAAESRETHQFDIKAQPLVSALLEFSKQADRQVVGATEVLREVRTPGVSGDLSVGDALGKLLEGTGLQYELVGEHSVRIVSGADRAVDARSASEGMSGVTRLAQVDASGAGGAAGTAENSTERSQEGERESAAAADSDSKLEEIVVTAQKRVERLIDVPQSMSVLSEDTLAKLGALQLRDFANSVPGLSFATAGAGNTRLVLRGVTTGFDIASTVGIYVDEVPYGSSSAFSANDQLGLDVGLFDIDRIEVLRGPQGTLYGASTMGGLLKYVTRQPDAGGFEANLRTGVSHTNDGDLSYNGAATVNIPIVADKVALRASGFYSRDGGYIDNVALGKENANRATVYGGRVNLLFLPTDALSVRIGGFLQNISREGEATSDFTFTGTPIDQSLDQRRQFPEPFDQRFRLASATVNYKLERATLTSISSYQTAESVLIQDVSPGYTGFINFIGIPASAVGTRNVISTDKFTQEIRLAAERAGPFEWIVGGYYTDEKTAAPQSLMVLDLAGQPAANVYDLQLPSRYEERAAFGDLTWHLNEKFDVTGGVRYALNRQSNEQVASASSLLVPSRLPGHSSEDVFTYLANARYRFSDRAIGYVRYATGYRPGGPNYSFESPNTGQLISPEPFEADRLKSYEVGYKSETADRRFGVDFAAYYIDWSNFQISVMQDGFAAKANATGGATVRGLELSLTTRPARGFSTSAALTLQDAELSDTEAALGGEEGERLPNVPRFTGSLLADYTFVQAPFEPAIGLTLRHVSNRKASFDGTQGYRQYDLPDYTTTDLRAEARLGETQLQFYVHNFFDERRQVSALNTWQGLARPAILQPRTIGINVSTRF